MKNVEARAYVLLRQRPTSEMSWWWPLSRNVLWFFLLFTDKGNAGLTKFQIALIIAILSSVVVLIVGAALIYCCVRSKEKSAANRRHRNRSHDRIDRTRFDHNDFTVSHVGDFVYSRPRGKRDRRRKRKQTRGDQRQRSNANASHHNRPLRLPTASVAPSAPPYLSTFQSPSWSTHASGAATTQNGGIHYTNGWTWTRMLGGLTPSNRQYNSHYCQWSHEIHEIHTLTLMHPCLCLFDGFEAVFKSYPQPTMVTFAQLVLPPKNCHPEKHRNCSMRSAHEKVGDN